ncbi:TTC13-like protein, partial [Mya arenaria]
EKQTLFTIEVANTRPRTADYHAELDYIYNQLQDEIRRTGSSKVSVSLYMGEMDPVINIILSMSVVAYSVALGLIMSVGRQLLEMEAMLSGAPDAFIMVTKQWMNIK